MMGISSLVLFLLVFLFRISAAQEMKGPGFTLHYQPGMERLAVKVEKLYPGLKAEVEAMLGLSYSGEESLYLLRGKEAFQRISGSLPEDWVAAIAIPEKELMILRLEKLTALRDDLLAGTLKHEYCHLVTGTALKASSLFPKWFSEGLSQWTADMLFMGREEELAFASGLNDLLSFYDLEKGFPKERSRISLAYLQGESLVRFMEMIYGRPALQAILAHMARGDDFYQAHADVTGKDFPSLVTEWEESLKGTSLLLLLASKVYPFFILMAVLVLLAFLRRRFKDTRIRRKWEKEGDLE